MKKNIMIIAIIVTLLGLGVLAQKTLNPVPNWDWERNSRFCEMVRYVRFAGQDSYLEEKHPHCFLTKVDDYNQRKCKTVQIYCQDRFGCVEVDCLGDSK